MANSGSPSVVAIRLLGGVELRRGDERLDLSLGSLVGYLALNRDSAQPRRRLAALLWPDTTESQARTNLRHVLHDLRRNLPDSPPSSTSRHPPWAGATTSRAADVVAVEAWLRGGLVRGRTDIEGPFRGPSLAPD